MAVLDDIFTFANEEKSDLNLDVIMLLACVSVMSICPICLRGYVLQHSRLGMTVLFLLWACATVFGEFWWLIRSQPCLITAAPTNIVSTRLPLMLAPLLTHTCCTPLTSLLPLR
jgi:glucan phosphoethanolaminetransferase (alkaline phosphatase superfamily)